VETCHLFYICKIANQVCNRRF